MDKGCEKEAHSCFVRLTTYCFPANLSQAWSPFTSTTLDIKVSMSARNSIKLGDIWYRFICNGACYSKRFFIYICIQRRGRFSSRVEVLLDEWGISHADLALFLCCFIPTHTFLISYMFYFSDILFSTPTFFFFARKKK